ncbi:uncharacterized protein C4orf54 homolog [Stigmatopora argus]
MKTERSQAAPPPPPTLPDDASRGWTGDTAGRTSDLGTDSDGDATMPSEDESHYISAGAVRLCEPSDEDDSDPGAGSLPSWDAEDAPGRGLSSTDGDGEPTTPRVRDVAVSSLRESDPSPRFGAGGEGGRQVRLSIKATSRAINDPVRENTLSRAKGAGDISPPAAEGPRDKVRSVFLAAGGKFLSEESTRRSIRRGVDWCSAFVHLKRSDASRGLLGRSTPEAEGRVFAEEMDPMAKLAQAHGGGARLTETLNFGCDVPWRVSAGENPAGRGSADELSACNLQGGGGAGPTNPATGVASTKGAEGGHKKAVFASSVIQNVLSKKMQFEQERRMERGEVREPRREGGPLGARGPQRPTPVCYRSHGEDHARATDPLPPDRTAVEAKRGSAEAPELALLAGQNSAFGRRGNEELGFPQDGKKPETQEARERDAAGGARATQMSHLFVPTLKRAAGGGAEERRPRLPPDRASYLTPGEGVGARQSPGIQIHLQSCDTGGPLIADHSDGRRAPAARKAAPSDGAPGFPLPDVGEGKGKLQTPIHHVRDVRQLVKSSYHFVSMDGKSQSCTAEPRRPTSLSPIVIRCQSVNTNGGKWDRTSTEPSSKSSPKGPRDISDEAVAAASSVERKPASTTDKVSQVAEKQPVSNRGALEKLRAAVKTMERLYVFDKNEWKRKNAPQPRTDSHVLSLIASEKRASVVGENHCRNSRPDLKQTAPRAGDPWDGPEAASPPTPRGKVPTWGRKASPGVPAAKSRRRPTPSDAGTEWSRLPTSFGVYPSQSSVVSGEIPTGDPDSDRDDHLALPPEFPAGSSRPIGPPSRAEEPSPPHVSPAAIYHPWPWAVAANQPQVYCISPALAPAPPTEPLSATRAKMLLDPASGSYYLVDAPLQAPTRHLLDPETGLYVEVPVPPPPVTPVPLAPLALSSAAYGHAYMIYPGFVTSPPVIPARAPARPPEDTYAQTPLDPGKAAAAIPNAVGRRGVPGGEPALVGAWARRGPWIVAPPSFDGTTVSFVLEHR